jgi:uncharacterized protein (DUF885 family)
MRNLICLLLLASLFLSCNQPSQTSTSKESNKDLAVLFENYYNGKLELYPVESTINGETKYNDRLPAEFTDSYRARIKDFFQSNLDAISKFDRESLNEVDQTSYDIFKREMEMTVEGLKHQYAFTTAYDINGRIPFQQFWALPLVLGQMGNGTGSQPFKTVADYDTWLKRAGGFSAWSDSAITYFRKGIADNYVLPQKIVIKMIPQMQGMVVPDVTKSLFYGPVTNFPKDFNEQDKKRLTDEYSGLIKNVLFPSYQKLAVFLKDEYLPKARTTTGLKDLPGGKETYEYLVRYWTTTNRTPDEIYNTGLAEVQRIRLLMDSIRIATGFKGDLQAFFEFMKKDRQFMPYKTSADVLTAFNSILARIQPNLQKMFGRTPKMKFEIRQTESFRAASASAEYIQGTADGSRPGIFYVPIIDATRFNTTSGMESLFLHEAIPGHHYQIALTIEDTTLPAFRRYLWYGAYGEGWALYCESLGKELGLYTDPYQYMGALGDEIHRAIRLVVDVGMHSKNMTREEAIKYMMENEAISEEGATAEIERYMVIPAQALSYKIGALKIKELRDKYSKQMGEKFNLASFHDEFLHFGCMPLELVEQNMDNWSNK